MCSSNKSLSPYNVSASWYLLGTGGLKKKNE